MSVQTIRRAASPVGVPARRLRALPPAKPARPRPGRGLFVLLLGSVLVAGLVGLLMLNTVLAQQSFKLHDLQRRQNVLDDTQAALRSKTDALVGPDDLAARATALGMVPGCDPVFAKASSRGGGSATILGTVTRVTGVRHGQLLVVAPSVAPPAPAPAAPGSSGATAPVGPPCPGTPAALQAQRDANAAALKAAAANPAGSLTSARP